MNLSLTFDVAIFESYCLYLETSLAFSFFSIYFLTFMNKKNYFFFIKNDGIRAWITHKIKIWIFNYIILVI